MYKRQLVGLTATPKDEVEKNTYEVFELEPGVPTYAYDLAQAVKDGFLVDFLTVESELKFLKEGITYDGLPEDEKEEYEATFTDENGDLPEKIEPAGLNEWVFNEDTIRKALDTTPDLFPQRATVACQGVEGAYSQIACDSIFKAPTVLYLSLIHI